MNKTLLRKVGQVEYSALRIPLELLDRRVAARYLAEDSKVRVALGRGIGALDAAAARLLGEPGGETTDAAPATRPEPAATPAAEPEIPVDEVERVAEELLVEQEETPLVGELAEADDDDARAMAELRAKHLVEEHEAQQRSKRSVK